VLIVVFPFPFVLFPTKPSAEETFVHAINNVRCGLNLILEDLLELGGHGQVGFPWVDRLQHADSDDVTFDATLIQSLVSDDADVSIDDVVQREAKAIKSLQLSFLKSKLFIGSNDKPYLPMVNLMDSTIKVCLLFLALSLHSFLICSLQSFAGIRAKMLGISNSDALLPEKTIASLKVQVFCLFILFDSLLISFLLQTETRKGKGKGKEKSSSAAGSGAEVSRPNTFSPSAPVPRPQPRTLDTKRDNVAVKPGPSLPSRPPAVARAASRLVPGSPAAANVIRDFEGLSTLRPSRVSADPSGDSDDASVSGDDDADPDEEDGDDGSGDHEDEDAAGNDVHPVRHTLAASQRSAPSQEEDTSDLSAPDDINAPGDASANSSLIPPLPSGVAALTSSPVLSGASCTTTELASSSPRRGSAFRHCTFSCSLCFTPLYGACFFIVPFSSTCFSNC
jgi:hypothetical protein